MIPNLFILLCQVDDSPKNEFEGIYLSKKDAIDNAYILSNKRLPEEWPSDINYVEYYSVDWRTFRAVDITDFDKPAKIKLVKFKYSIVGVNEKDLIMGNLLEKFNIEEDSVERYFIEGGRL